MQAEARSTGIPLQEQSARAPHEADDLVTLGLRRAAARIDRLLSDERSRAEENRSSWSLRFDTLAEEHERPDFALRADARVVLPRTEDRLHVVLGGDPDATDERAVLRETNVPAGSTSGEPRNPTLALQYLLKSTRSNDIRPEAGAHFHDFEPDPFVGLRWRHLASLRPWQVRGTQRVRALADAGMETRTIVDLERGVADELLLRFSTRALWREEEPQRELGERLTLFQPVGSRTLLAYECDTSVVSGGDGAQVETLARVRLSRRFAEERILIELSPQVAWREREDFEPVAGVFVRVVLDFGRED